MRKTYISIGSLFSGRFVNNDIVTIDGRFEGASIKAKEVFVGKTGRVKSRISADHIIIEGVVIGDIESSNRIILMPTARVLGKIVTKELIIQKGVMFEGTCVIVNELDSKSARQTIQELYGRST